MASTTAVVPTFKKVATSDRLASPTMTWRRRNRLGSAWGSSRVFTIGRLSVVSRPDDLLEELGPLGDLEVHRRRDRGQPVSTPTLPAPVKIWRVTKWGTIPRTTLAKGTARSIR